MVQASKRYLAPQTIKNMLGSPLLFIILAFVYPAVYLIHINSHIYTKDQILVTLIFIVIVSLITTVILGISTYYLAKIILIIVKKFRLLNDEVKFSAKLHRAFLGSAGTLILLVLLHAANRELITIFHDVFWAPVYFLISFAVGILAYRYDLIIFNLILSVLIGINTAGMLYHGLSGGLTALETKEIEQDIVFKQKPNVYLVILESYASLDIREKIYGINNDALVRELNQKNYVIYKTYANYQHSLGSVASIFMMNHHYYKLSRGNADGYYRNIIGGAYNNPVINIFLNNGYRIDYSKFSSYLYHPSSAVESQIVLPLLQPLEVFSGFFQISNRILKYFSLGTEFFQSLLWLPEKILNRPVKTLERVSIENDGKPVFYAIYAGATHSPGSIVQYPREIRDIPGSHKLPIWKLNHINNYWTKTYRNVVAESDASLIELVRNIDEKDPDAIVILIGDHGPWLNNNRWMGSHEDLNNNMLENDIHPKEVSRDIFEVFMAIKWPSNFKLTDAYFSHVNLFRYIFTALIKDDAMLISQVANNSFMSARRHPYLGTIKTYLTVKEGNLLDSWDVFTIPESQ